MAYNLEIYSHFININISNMKIIIIVLITFIFLSAALFIRVFKNLEKLEDEIYQDKYYDLKYKDETQENN